MTVEVLSNAPRREEHGKNRAKAQKYVFLQEQGV